MEPDGDGEAGPAGSEGPEGGPEDRVLVNGVARVLTRRDLLGALGDLGYDTEQHGIAVAVNGEVVPRARWRDASLAPGDAVEVVEAIQGG